MARITVEDCIDKFPSRFELVLVASNRARKLHSGESPTIDKDNDKNTVIALREIAKESIQIEELKNDLIEEYQTATLNEDEDLLDNDENNVSSLSNDEENSLNPDLLETSKQEDESIETENISETEDILNNAENLSDDQNIDNSDVADDVDNNLDEIKKDN